MNLSTINPDEVRAAAMRLGYFTAPKPIVQQPTPRVKLPPQQGVSEHAMLMRKRRAALVAKGLTAAGTIRKRKQRPELKGLGGRVYKRLYTRLWRAERKATP